jgi:GT2 family glycosyltransferase
VTTDVSVVIPSVGRPACLAACLEGLARQTVPPRQVVVVLEPSDGASHSVLRWDLPLTVVAHPEGGFVSALLAGASGASAGAVAFLDDDSIPAPDWIERIGEWLEAPDIGGVGGRIRNHIGGTSDTRTALDPALPVARVGWWGRTFSQLWSEPSQRVVRDVDFLPGANMCFRRSIVLYLHPQLDCGMCPGNELEFALAAKHAGFRVVYDSDIVVDHFPAERVRGVRRDDLVRRGSEYARSLTYVLSGWLPAYRLAAFIVYFFVVGQRAAPGLVVLPFMVRRTGLRESGRLFVAATRGKVSGLTEGVGTRADRRRRARSGGDAYRRSADSQVGGRGQEVGG